MKYLPILSFFLTSLYGYSTDLKVSDPLFYFENDEAFAIVTVQWNNAWKNKRNHDAAWIFGKYLRGINGYVHATITKDGTRVVESNTRLQIEVPSDGTGFFIYPSSDYRGNIRATVRFSMDTKAFDRMNPFSVGLKVFGIEMVYIPEGPVTLGDNHESQMTDGAFYLSDASGKKKGNFKITKEDQVVEIGPNNGQLYYQAKNQYQGDQKGTVGTKFPKGVRAFYIMKYEPTQGQYAEFLNTLSEGQSHHRIIFGGKEYYLRRGTISNENEVYVAGSPSRPYNFAGWEDGIAFADWAGLRPMTEFEFTKACRGSNDPRSMEYPWGTDAKENVLRIVDENGDLTMRNGWKEEKLSEETRTAFGASYLWVMDLAGSMWERVVSVGDSVGRAYDGTHGDGNISDYGFADAPTWPRGFPHGEGFGFRGGAYYQESRAYNMINPYSPIANRSYGGWPGGNRKEAYGQRFVRTAGM